MQILKDIFLFIIIQILKIKKKKNSTGEIDEEKKTTRMTHVVIKKISENIWVSEVVCPHCGKGADLIHSELIKIFEGIRDEISDYFSEDTPLVITSGYRCRLYTKFLIAKGIDTSLSSPHIYGVAFDIRIPKNITKEAFVQIIRIVGERFGGVRIGWKKYTSHVHIDVAHLIPTKNRPSEKAKISWIAGVEW